MNLSTIKTIGTRLLGRSSARLGKHAPAILTGVGVVGIVATVVLSSRATLKLEAELDEINSQKDFAEVRRAKGIITLDEFQKDVRKIYIHGTKRIVKLYAPSVTLGVASIACVLSGHGMLSKRNVALAAAYKAVETTYNSYRQEVISEYGEEKDHDIRRKISSKLEERVVLDESGEEKILKRSTHDHSQYARFFDEYNENRKLRLLSSPRQFLKSVQNYCNDRLLAVGHIFLNEVYERLGFQHTQAGAIVGWTITPGSDNYVDFGIFNSDSEAARDFVNGYEKSILLDFNVDGIIYDKI